MGGGGGGREVRVKARKKLACSKRSDNWERRELRKANKKRGETLRFSHYVNAWNRLEERYREVEPREQKCD